VLVGRLPEAIFLRETTPDLTEAEAKPTSLLRPNTHTSVPTLGGLIDKLSAAIIVSSE
jgi:hypothetical protein